jgi:hypothetical protein
MKSDDSLACDICNSTIQIIISEQYARTLLRMAYRDRRWKINLMVENNVELFIRKELKKRKFKDFVQNVNMGKIKG